MPSTQQIIPGFKPVATTRLPNPWLDDPVPNSVIQPGITVNLKYFSHDVKELGGYPYRLGGNNESQVVYYEYHGTGPPPRDIGYPGDIYIDTTPGAEAAYGRGFWGWSEPSSSVGLAVHPQIVGRFLWCTATEVGWLLKQDVVAACKERGISYMTSQWLADVLRPRNDGSGDRICKRKLGAVEDIGTEVSGNKQAKVHHGVKGRPRGALPLTDIEVPTDEEEDRFTNCLGDKGPHELNHPPSTSSNESSASSESSADASSLVGRHHENFAHAPISDLENLRTNMVALLENAQQCERARREVETKRIVEMEVLNSTLLREVEQERETRLIFERQLEECKSMNELQTRLIDELKNQRAELSKDNDELRDRFARLRNLCAI